MDAVRRPAAHRRPLPQPLDDSLRRCQRRSPGVAHQIHNVAHNHGPVGAAAVADFQRRRVARQCRWACGLEQAPILCFGPSTEPTADMGPEKFPMRRHFARCVRAACLQRVRQVRVEQCCPRDPRRLPRRRLNVLMATIRTSIVGSHMEVKVR